MSGRLFVCGTPIGNLEDATFRLIRVLSEVDVVAAEDTRRTRKLLTHYGIHARLVSHHEGNERTEVPRLVERLIRGERVALVTDAGMPTISDPGYRLVRACIREGVPVEVVPGPSAVVSALAVSGLSPARFAFEGFLPRKAGERRRRLQGLSRDERTLVIFEAPYRILRTLGEIREIFGERQVAVARELTKVHEEVVRGSVSEAMEVLAARKLQGEIVLIVEGAGHEEGIAAARPQNVESEAGSDL